MSTDDPRPPELLSGLVSRAVGKDEAEFVLGDLEEEYRRNEALRGRLAANLWYGWQVCAMVVRWPVLPRGGGGMEGMMRDFRLGVRGLVRTPGYVGAVALTLALGLGGTVTVLAIGASVLRPLPFPESDRLVSLAEVHEGAVRSVAPANYLDWRRSARSFQGLTAYMEKAASLTFGGAARRGTAAEVSGNFFDVLGATPMLGRTFDPTLDLAFPGREAVLGYRLWLDALSGDDAVVGTTFQVDDLTYEIVGVMPPSFRFPDDGVQLWLRSPHEAPDIRGFPGELTETRDAWYFDVVGRLAPDVSMETASEEMDAVAARLAEVHPDTNRDAGVRLTSLLEDTVASFRATLTGLRLAVVLLLAAACVNLAHLTLARSEERRGAMAVRVAVGATRHSLVRLVLAEGWIVGVVGTLLGVGLASLAVRSVADVFGDALPRAAELTLRPGVLGLALGLGIAVTTLLTLLTFRAPSGAHRMRSRGGTDASRLRDGLVVAQVAAAVALWAGAALVGRSLLNLSRVDPGFDASGLVTLRVSLPDARLRPYQERLAVYQDLMERMRSVPGVGDVGLASTGPLSMGPSASVLVAGVRDDRNAPNAGWQPVTPGYLSTLRVPLLSGRGFDEGDGPGAIDVGILNKTLARLRFPGQDPLGRQITVGIDGHDRPITVVGVVGDTRTRGPAVAPAPMLYRPVAQTGRRGFAADAVFMAVSAPDAPESLPSTLRDVIREAAPGLAVYAVARGEDLVAPFLRGSQGVLMILGVFAVTTMLLCAVGVYGVASYLVRRRRREIGIRLAVGADAARVLREVMASGVARAAWGVPIGLLLTWGLARSLRSVLFEVPAADALTYGAAGALVLVVVALALWIPARMAAATDAAVALRSE